jgi:hypothetical protein
MGLPRTVDAPPSYSADLGDLGVGCAISEPAEGEAGHLAADGRYLYLLQQDDERIACPAVPLQGAILVKPSGHVGFPRLRRGAGA